jgi:hypothetical protein
LLPKSSVANHWDPMTRCFLRLLLKNFTTDPENSMCK